MTERQAITWRACDALSAAGQKPSIGLVRAWTLEHTGAHRGSSGDVQADIAAWYGMVFRLRHEKPIPNIPDPIANSMQALWAAALSAADDALTSEREKLAAERTEMESLVDGAQANAAAATEIANNAKNEIQVAQATIAGRDETIKRLEQALTEIRLVVAAKDERIAALTADLATKEKERATVSSEIEGLRRSTLLQLDHARGDARTWKAEYDRLHAEHKSAATLHLTARFRLEHDLAATHGRLSALEETLKEARERSVELENELSATKLRETAIASRQTPTKRRATGAGQARPVLRRKL